MRYRYWALSFFCCAFSACASVHIASIAQAPIVGKIIGNVPGLTMGSIQSVGKGTEGLCQIEYTNDTYQRLVFRHRARWTDESGILVKPVGTWQYLSLESKESRAVQYEWLSGTEVVFNLELMPKE